MDSVDGEFFGREHQPVDCLTDHWTKLLQFQFPLVGVFGTGNIRPMECLIDRWTDTASASVSSQFLFLRVFWTGTSTNGLFDGTVPNWYVRKDIPAQPRFRPVPVLERLLNGNINCWSVGRTAGRCSILRCRTVPVLASGVFWTGNIEQCIV